MDVIGPTPKWREFTRQAQGEANINLQPHSHNCTLHWLRFLSSTHDYMSQITAIGVVLAVV
jgi:hypothetical protein